MNKKILLLIITIFLLLAGCGKVTSNNTAQQINSAVEKSPTITTKSVVSNQNSITTITPSLTAETKKQPYSIITSTFIQENIKVQYPQIKGLRDNSKQKAINDLIKKDVLNSQVEAPIKYYQDETNTKIKLTLNLKYQVTMNTNKLLSVIYTGDGNIEGSAYPTKAIHAVTIDIQNAAKLKLSDFTNIDANLAQKIKQSTAVTNEAVKNGMNNNVLISEIQDKDDQTLIEGLKKQWAYYTFYVKPNSLVISVAISHVSGDYALIELPGQYTKK